MARPRFHKLDPEKQKAILLAAGAEFAEHGYQEASINRIIEGVGLSKGAMYYYFDGKEELYETVIQDFLSSFQHVMAEVSEPETAQEYWGQFEEMAKAGVQLYVSDPVLAKLLRTFSRDLTTGSAPPRIREIYYSSFGFIEEFLGVGLKVGAIRSDLPADLLVNLAMVTGEAMDIWFAEHWETLKELNGEVLEGYAHDMTLLYRQFFEANSSGELVFMKRIANLLNHEASDEKK